MTTIQKAKPRTASRKGKKAANKPKARLPTASDGMGMPPSSPIAAQSQLQALENQLFAVRAIGEVLATEVGLEALFRRIVPQVSKLMAAERTTLFLYDAVSQEIWSKVAEGDNVKEIRLPLGTGIAGWVAQNRKALNIPDAYQDARFNAAVDAETGFRTHSVAAVPLVSKQGDLLGVLQVLNHDAGTFADDALGLLEVIAVQTAYAVENAHLAQALMDQNDELDAARHRAERRRGELDLLYQLERETAEAEDLNTLLDSTIVRACGRLRSRAGSVLLTDTSPSRLFFRPAASDAAELLQRQAGNADASTVGWVAAHGEPIIINHPVEGPHIHKALAAVPEYPAKPLLAVPLIWDRRIIGAMEVIDPSPRPSGATGYDLEDLKVLTLIAGQVARAVSLTTWRQARMDTERLAAVGRMLAGVAHDLRNPMTVISGYAQLMAGDEVAEEREERCNRILQQIDEMTAMINDLLAFSRGDSKLRPSSVDLESFAAEIRETLQLHCGPRGIGLGVESEAGAVRVDAARTKRIIYNLAKNAVDVLGRGGQLEIRLLPRDEGLTLQVRDTGPGIPENIRSRIFDPFVTAGKRDGTGLGLAIVKRFVDDHGGEVSIDSRQGEGTTFNVHLPKAT